MLAGGTRARYRRPARLRLMPPSRNTSARHRHAIATRPRAGKSSRSRWTRRVTARAADWAGQGVASSWRTCVRTRGQVASEGLPRASDGTPPRAEQVQPWRRCRHRTAWANPSAWPRGRGRRAVIVCLKTHMPDRGNRISRPRPPTVPDRIDADVQQIGVRLLPARILGFPEQVAQDRRDRVGHGVRIEIVVQGVVADARDERRSRRSRPAFLHRSSMELRPGRRSHP